ncbi:kinase-like domain-containing protein [Aspergillus avenaceus]|uniref:Kinase-like domain-containing protein n=1 Tax=Aspergillus avenaceus TaxID=36643 RepID=A0A5N6U0A6_ASPAV|nr:kinase-like domain-containing protein [Aspergillus avenaceus]
MTEQKTFVLRPTKRKSDCLDEESTNEACVNSTASPQKRVKLVINPPKLRLKLTLHPLPSTYKGEKIPKLEENFESDGVLGQSGFIGQGGFGSVKIVYKRSNKETRRTKNKAYAAKVVKRIQGESLVQYTERVFEEYSISKRVKHPNTVMAEKLTRDQESLSCVMEYCKHGDLWDLIRKGYLSWEDKKCLFKQLLLGVGHMHRCGIAHHDIKPENAVLGDDSVLKICDFGLAHVVETKVQVRTDGKRKQNRTINWCEPSTRGTISYLPPEAIEPKDKYDPWPVDVWSCAITGIHIFCGENPWNTANSEEDGAYADFLEAWTNFLEEFPYSGITKTRYPVCRDLFAFLPVGLQHLLIRMLHPFPEMRITMRDVLKDAWVQDIECCSPGMPLSVPRPVHDHRPPNAR